ncbi:MAG: transketolase [Candidatus Desulfofervidaceae bacterium]|nr:transketolase [Candidatus Desulfofervidaceae bacterium]
MRNIDCLRQIAREVRKDILTMLNKAGSGHTGGSLSAVELLTALFFAKLRHDPQKPCWKDRDRFILSKGHAAPVLYAILARCGYFEREELLHLRELGSRLQGHPDSKFTPGVEVPTGSLGQGLSMANGIALAARLDGLSTRVYVLLGDGEVQEGQVWEAAMTAGHYKLDNVCAILDNNGLQIDGWVKDVKNVEPLAPKWEAFGWAVLEIDGHNFGEILSALDKAEEIKGKPTIIIAHTVKGKGVSFFENKAKYHGVAPTNEELERALKELENA